MDGWEIDYEQLGICKADKLKRRLRDGTHSMFRHVKAVPKKNIYPKKKILNQKKYFFIMIDVRNIYFLITNEFT